MQDYSDSLSPQPVPVARPRDDDTADVWPLFSTIWRGKLLIALAALLALSAGVYQAFIAATPAFQSTAVLVLDTRSEGVLDFDSMIGNLKGDDTDVNTEIVILQSRGLMAKAVDRLNLTEDPEFNTALADPSPIGAMAGALKDRIKSLLGAGAGAAALTPGEERERTYNKVVEALMSKVSVTNVPLSYVFRLTVETGDPRKSALIANTIAGIYIREQIEVKFAATELAAEWLSGRVGELQGELEAAEAKVADFNAGTDLVSPDALRAQEIQLKDLRQRIALAAADLEQSQATLDRLQQASSREETAAIASDALLRRYLANGKDEAFDARAQQLRAQLQQDLARKRRQHAALATTERELSGQLSRRSQDLITLQQLEREADAVRLLYEYFLSRLKETAAQQGLQKADSRILSKAVVPTEAASPKKSRILGIWLVLGMVAGTGWVLLREEMRRSSFRTARELEDFSRYAVLGQIPRARIRRRSEFLPYLAAKPTSATAEAIRNLRTTLLLNSSSAPPKVILCTSSLPNEGKTATTLALAQHFAGLDKSVLAIEGDLRRRTFLEHLPAEQHEGREKGLVSVLSGGDSFDEAVQRNAGGYKFDVLFGGAVQATTPDLFSTPGFQRLMQELRGKYDVILIDTPPVLLVPDARAVAQASDATLLMVAWNRTSRAQVEESIRLFRKSRQQLSGLVLTSVNLRKMKKMQYGDSAGYSAGYYSN